MRRSLPLALLALTGACATVRVGGPSDGGAPATVTADPRINAGLPVVVALRKVDDVEVGPFYSHASLPPGEHRLLVDCTVAESHATSRYALTLDAEPGAHYRLVADLAPGNQHCDDVRLDRR